MPRKKKLLCFETATAEEVAMLSKYGDPEALSRLWESTLPTIDRIAGYFHAKYPWIEQEEIAQSLSLEVPKIVQRFDPMKARQGVKRYFYFALYRAAQDFFRREDPLGVRIPHKRRYPSFAHFGGFCLADGQSFPPNNLDEIIAKGLDNMDRGYLPDIEPRKRPPQP